MKRGVVVDADWGLNGEDEKNLWEEWAVDNKNDSQNVLPDQFDTKDLENEEAGMEEEKRQIWDEDRNEEVDKRMANQLKIITSMQESASRVMGQETMKRVGVAKKKVAVFAKPQIPGISQMTRGQVNEMCWAISHLVPEKELAIKKGQLKLKKNAAEEIKRSFWFKYTKVMRSVDKTSVTIPLSTFSPGALQGVWERAIAHKCVKLSKEVFTLSRDKMKLSTSKANRKDDRIY